MGDTKFIRLLHEYCHGQRKFCYFVKWKNGEALNKTKETLVPSAARGLGFKFNYCKTSHLNSYFYGYCYFYDHG